MEDLDAIAVFVAIVDAGSLSAAARRLGVSKSHVSKRLSALEERLGARLLNRTTRRLALTEVGAAFHQRAAHALSALEEAELAVTQMQSTPRGTLRISLPTFLGRNYLMPLLARFMRAHPDLRVEASLADRQVDLVGEGFDMAIRVSRLKDSTLIARKLAPVSLFVCAAESYVEAHGEPRTPADLARHESAIYTVVSTSATMEFVSAEGRERVSVQGRLHSNDTAANIGAAAEGLCIVSAPDFMVGEALQSGRLRRLLPEWHVDSGAVWAVYPQSRHLSAKVRLFVDFLAEAMKPDPPWHCPQ